MSARWGGILGWLGRSVTYACRLHVAEISAEVREKFHQDQPRQAPPAALATAMLATNSGTVTVVCEPINKWLAITPVLAMDEDGKTWFDGGFSITHVPTGTEFADGPACISCCRNVGRELTSLDVDWSGLGSVNSQAWVDSLSSEVRMAIAMARALNWRCDAEYCRDAAAAAPSPSGASTEGQP
jgi:hypothetical protein